MNLEYVPLLQVQRELHGLPRNFDRFREYLATVLTPDRTGVELPPLILMNPMGKDHVTALLDALLALDADGIAARAVAEASARLAEEPGDFKATLVIVDDLKGGWTNRYATEFTLRFGPDHLRFLPASVSPPDAGGRYRGGWRPKWTKHSWVTAALWSSEPATERAVRETILTVIYRIAYVQRHGHARTIRDMLAQEGHVMAMAGCTGPVLDEEDIDYTREVLIPYLDAEDMRTAIECLFGDAAGRTLGFTPRGLSPWAGLALAFHDARRDTAMLART
jgi:hypothetical protein